jgi:hypothetical protein
VLHGYAGVVRRAMQSVLRILQSQLYPVYLLNG